MGFALPPGSTGTIEPSTLQYAGRGGAAGFQLGALNVTPATGSPIDCVGIEVPNFAAVQSVSARFFTSACPHRSPAAQNTQVSLKLMGSFNLSFSRGRVTTE
jgi:hypothetical protein